MLFQQLGAPGADSVVNRALDEISQRLIELRRLHGAEEWDVLSKRSRGLVAIAEQVGMTRFAQVAADVSACAARGDGPALAATLARLDRLADRSLMAMWDLQDRRV